jgi:uracil-DNA glycosylase family 4
MNNHIIHIDGADKTGKDTIRGLLVKNSNGKYLVYVRSFISQIVYSRIYDRGIDESYFWDRFVHASLACDERFFLLTCNVEQATKRFIDHNEKDLHIDRFAYHQEMFLKVVEEAKTEYHIKVGVLDTSHNFLQHTYDEIQQSILYEDIQYCNECDLCSMKQNKFCYEKGEGKLIPQIFTFQPKYLIIGINQSKTRVAYTKHPFEQSVDDNKNNLFHKIISELGIEGRSVITNAVKCSTNNNKITQKDFDVCLFHLKNEIELFKPEYLIVMGSDIYHMIFNSGIFDTNKIVKIYHPSYQYGYNKITQSKYKKHIAEQLKSVL